MSRRFPQRRSFLLIACVLAVAGLWHATRPVTPPLAEVSAVAPSSGRVQAADASVLRSAAAAPAPLSAHPGAEPAAPSPLLPRYDVPSKAEQYRRIALWSEGSAAVVATSRSGDRIEIPLFDGRILHGRVNSVLLEADGHRIIAGELLEESAGTFSFGVADGRVGGLVLPDAGMSAFLVETGRDGRSYLTERFKPSVVCTEFPKAAANATTAGEAAVVADAAGSEYLLSSRPTATAVAYLDFDGESVTDPVWNGGATIVATASGLSAAQIIDTWRRVAEDYRSFNIDVTTNRARYDAAPVKSRMRCIVTQNSGWYGSAGGVAYISSWRQAGTGSFSSTVPCWVFSNMLQTSPRYVAEAASHEIGHTLGLSHDGVMDASGTTTTEYYSGHAAGNTGWAPIMGVGYYQYLVQWSKGEYTPPGGGSANNVEDDLAIIASSANNTGYVADDAAGTVADASVLRFASAGVVDTVGTIERTGDADVYAFTTSGGLVSFTFSPEVSGGEATALTNLDAKATLYDANGAVVASADPSNDLFPNLSATVGAGTYFLSIAGVGQGTTSDGYTNYGSLGRYGISGSVPVDPNATPVVVGGSAITVAIGSSVNYMIQATGSPTSFGASGLPAGVSLNSSTGVISGTPTVAGVFPLVLTATNAFGSGTRSINLAVTSVFGSAVESPTLPWATGGGANWAEDTVNFHDGASAVRSGAIGANGETWIETTVVGAGTLSFWWKVSSESGADYLRFKVDGVEVTKISGTVAWTQVTQAIAAGSHTVRWSYTKNNRTNSGSDAGWLDGVSFVKSVVAPVITSATSARCIIGLPFSYQIAASNSPTSFGASGLPPGLSVNSDTGLISGVAAATAARGLTATTISASNSAGTGSASFTVEVVTAFTAWTQDTALSGNAALPAADPDGDGVVNLLEYAFARSATTIESPAAKLPQTSLIDDAGTPRLEAVFTIPSNRPDLVYTVQVSSDLVTWTNGHAYGVGVVNGSNLPTAELSRTAVTGGEQIVVVDLGGSGAAPRFIRVAISTQ